MGLGVVSSFFCVRELLWCAVLQNGAVDKSSISCEQPLILMEDLRICHGKRKYMRRAQLGLVFGQLVSCFSVWF